MNLMQRCGFVEVVEGVVKQSAGGFRGICAGSMFLTSSAMNLGDFRSDK